MSSFRTAILLVLLVSHVLLGGGFFVSCIEQDGARSTELALAVCCDDTSDEAPRAPDAPSTLDDAGDCNACVDERLQAPAERPTHGTPAPLLVPPAVVVAIVELEVAPRAAPFELASVPPDTTPRRMRPALLRS